MKREIVFIVGLLSQPRCIKRIKAISEEGHKCIVYGYNRGKYDINKYPDGIEVIVLSELHDGAEYIKKFTIIWKDINYICGKYKDRELLFYAFGFIQAVILMLKRRNYVYEISDILYAYPKFKMLLTLFKWIDKKVIRRSVVTLMTSRGFYDFYGINSDNIVIQPNKVSPFLQSIERKVRKNNSKNLNFGFVGAIRYESIFRFAQIIGGFFPQHNFLFFGGATGKTAEEIEVLITRYKNIKYFGAFKSPDDLHEIYNKLDVTVACYDVSSLNEQLAEPNKLYETILFCKPIIVSKGIYLSKRVNELGCGYSIDASNKDAIVSFLNSLTPQSVNLISQNEFLIPLRDVIDDPTEFLNKLSN